MQWSAADLELTATWLSADATKAKQPHFSCGSPDHLAPHCPLKASVAAPGRRCPICNHLGHTTCDCPLLSQDSATRTTSQPLVSPPSYDDDNICRVYNKRTFCFRGAKCPYMHICTACWGGHPQCACPNRGTLILVPIQSTHPYDHKYLRDFLLSIQTKSLFLG